MTNLYKCDKCNEIYTDSDDVCAREGKHICWRCMKVRIWDQLSTMAWANWETIPHHCIAYAYNVLTDLITKLHLEDESRKPIYDDLCRDIINKNIRRKTEEKI